jgi:hypothetical protein
VAGEYKALTVVNLPFIGKDGGGKKFNAGDMIPHSDFEDYCDAAAAVVEDRTGSDEGASPLPTPEDVIAYMTEWGSISDDANAELHHDHRPVDPNKPTLARLISMAQTMKDEYAESGVEIPAELEALATLDHTQVSTDDAGEGADRVG